MGINRDYTRFTYQELLTDFRQRLSQDERFKDISSASLFSMFMEMLASTVDMTNYYIARTSEESFIDSARLDSSHIKLAKNFGYSPIRSVPAQVELMIEIGGILPKGLKAGSVVYFSQADSKLSFNGFPFILASDYSYTFTQEDIDNGTSSSWRKRITFSKAQESMRYHKLADIKLFDTESLETVKAYQGEIIVSEISAKDNYRKIGRGFQIYDIDDLSFSNWYASRDPKLTFGDNIFIEDGFTKVGIGKTQLDAFERDNLYQIEDYSVFLNKDVNNFEVGGDEPLKICSITSNSDKTVRITFGDGHIVSNGLTNVTDNIYVQYLRTRGREANTLGTLGSQFSISNKFYSTGSGEIIDVTNNVKILLNSDIFGGSDFESQTSIKNNAPKYFSSNNRLVTKQDFVSYFNTLTTPLDVKHSIVYDQEDLEKLNTSGSTTYKYLQNLVLYCLVGSPYNINDKINGVKDVLLGSGGDMNFTVYGTGNEYLNHLTDFTKILLSYNSFSAEQYTNNPSEQWLKNISLIRENIKNKMIMNTRIYSMPPIVQYYDVVGTVEVNSLSKLQTYKTEVENDIYKWLSENTTFNSKIYKADLIKFFTNRSETKSVDLGIKVSEKIKAEDVRYDFNLRGKGYEDIYYDNPNIPRGGAVIPPDSRVKPYNTIIIPKVDLNGRPLSASLLRDKTLRFGVTLISTSSGNYSLENTAQFIPMSVNEMEESLVITFYGFKHYIPTLREIGDNSVMTLTIPSQNDFVSTSNFNENNNELYGLSYEDVASIKNDVKSWIDGCTIVSEANRPIPLPYFLSVMDSVVHEESLMRVGVLKNTLRTELNEKSFWQYFVPMIIGKYYNLNLLDYNSEEVGGNLWTQIDNLIMDLYKELKPAFTNSLIDDNGNVINYSMDNEISVFRLNIAYKYRG